MASKKAAVGEGAGKSRRVRRVAAKRYGYLEKQVTRKDY